MKIAHSKPCIDRMDLEKVGDVLRSGFLSTGSQCVRFGSACAKILGKNWGIPTQSGTDAITAALRLLKLGKDAKIAVPGYICSAVLDAAHIEGITPVPVDIERETLSISPALVNEFADANAVLGAHLFGIPAPLNRIRNKNLIEDCAQTLGIKNCDGIVVGAMGKFSICSFYATKLLTTGHGGLLAGDCAKMQKEAMRLFTHDKQDKWEPHLHFLMSDFNAALGISQAAKLENFIAKRRKVAARFIAAMGGKKLPLSIFSRFLVIPEKEGLTDKIIADFNKRGIEAKKPVFKPLYRYMGLKDKDFPNSCWAHRNIISIPIYPEMEETHIQMLEKNLQEKKNVLRCWPPA